MSYHPLLREATQSISLPANVPSTAVFGQRGKVLKRFRDLTGARVSYSTEDNRLDFFGRPSEVAAAAGLAERTVRQYLNTGQHIARKQVLNVLCPELSTAPAVHLLPASRPITTLTGPVEAFFLSPSSSPPAFPSPSSSLPFPPPAARAPQQPLLLPASSLDACLDQLIDLATTLSLEHPAECDSAELRLYLGKAVLSEVATSVREVAGEELLEWRYPLARAMFDTSLPRDTISSLDRHLTSRGLVPTQQTKSASLHLESSIPWIQYHPTFVVQPADGTLRLHKLETQGCKPFSLALVGLPDQLDVRMRYVATTQYGDEDPVAAELRRRESEFALVNNVQVTIPADLRESLDLTLTSARVKLKRVYVTPQPMRPPLPPSSSSSSSSSSSPAAAAAAAVSTSTPVKRTRGRKSVASAASSSSTSTSTTAPPPQPASDLPPISLRVSVAAVVDNLGGKRLEVTVACPEINEALLQLHRQRAEAPGFREVLGGQLRSLLAHMEDLRANVAFEP
ncbi:hypothetical protein Agub_g11785 [Astrephomene gubernaculifera]|uniref:K Homology domain-containing protein n=1 Tax=Astrephomene gubernaculifera TaxID=47775 RepID=A0AAD3DXS1_9CHLO|nr:hypothetical protein Agub_g11785 [Astrephomene gubernaculifera]